MTDTYIFVTKTQRIQMEHWLNCEENVLLQWDSCLAMYKATLTIQLLSVFYFPETDK